MEFNDIALNSDFIKNVMPKAPAIYTLVYICALSLEECCISEVSHILNISENDVTAAAMYWQDRHFLAVKDGYIYIDKNNANNESKLPKQEEIQKPECKHYISDTTPKYDPQEIAMYIEKNEDVRSLFEMSQQKLGRLLTQSDMNTIFSLFYWLNMKLETIELLLDYCVSKGHKNMRYIERVAIDWCESGFTDADDIREQLTNYNTYYRAIMKAFGQSGRNPVAAEEKFMMKWLNVYKMPMELITLACEKTIMNTGKAAFSYADSIITKWHDSGFKIKADVEAAEKAFAQSKQKQAEQHISAAKQTPKSNKFNNYTQRQYDYDKIEKLMREDMDK
jgi:DnaD/phage-associated family protein